MIAPTARVLVGARRAGIRIAYLKMAFQPDLSDAGLPQSPNWLTHQRMNVGQSVIAPNGSPSRILIRDTWNTAIVDELAPQPGDLVMYKASVQRVLRHGPGREAQGLGHPESCVHRLYDQRVR